MFSDTYFIFKCYTTSGHDFLAFCTLRCKLLLKTTNAIHIRIVRNDKRFASNLLLANHALETLVVPLLCLVFHLFHSWSKRISTSVTSTCKFGIVTGSAKNKGVFRGKRFIYQGCVAFLTGKTSFVPMHVLVRHVLGI